MAGVAESLVADLAGLDVAQASRRDSHWCGSGVCAQALRVIESGWIVTDFAENPGSQDRPKTGN
jgi:hypothetical protein